MAFNIHGVYKKNSAIYDDFLVQHLTMFLLYFSDKEKSSIESEGKSFIEFKPWGNKCHALLFFVQFKLTKQTGVILHRHYKNCLNEVWEDSMILRLVDGYIHFEFYLTDGKVLLEADTALEVNIFPFLLFVFLI